MCSCRSNKNLASYPCISVSQSYASICSRHVSRLIIFYTFCCVFSIEPGACASSSDKVQDRMSAYGN